MYKIIITTRELETGKHIEGLLEHEGVEQCRVAISFVEASKWDLDFQPDCIFYERSLVKEVQDAFQAIDCLNTGRFVADIQYPVRLKDVKKALANLSYSL